MTYAAGICFSSSKRSVAWLSVLLLLAQVSHSEAQTVTMADGNSTDTLNLTGPSAGMTSWTVDGQNQLVDQWFYYRVGSTGTAASVGSLPLCPPPCSPPPPP